MSEKNEESNLGVVILNFEAKLWEPVLTFSFFFSSPKMGT